MYFQNSHKPIFYSILCNYVTGNIISCRTNLTKYIVKLVCNKALILLFKKYILKDG